MKKNNMHFFIHKLLSFWWLCFIATTVSAGTPLWTFEQLTATTIQVPANGTAMVQYRVTNQSSKPHTLAVQPIQGIEQTTTGLGVPRKVPALDLGVSGLLTPKHIARFF